MSEGKPTNRYDDFERASREQDQQYLLRLYVAGLSPRSLQALDNIKHVCDEHLAGRYELEVIDIYTKRTLAADEQVVAVPTLIKQFPLPLRRIIGDLSDKEKLLFGLDLKLKQPPHD